MCICFFPSSNVYVFEAQISLSVPLPSLVYEKRFITVQAGDTE